MNRVRSPKYPNSVCAVVKQRHQFSWFYDGKPDIPKVLQDWEQSKSVAEKFLYKHPIVEIDLSEGALYYHATYVNPKWAREKTFILQFGGHKFYR